MKKVFTCCLLALVLCSCKADENNANGIIYTYVTTINEFEKTYNSNTDKWVGGVFTIDNLNVKDDEILLDIYSKDENGYVYVGLKEDYDKMNYTEVDNASIKCPSIDYKLNEEGEYVIVMKSSKEADVAFPVELQYGKHYVIAFGDTKEIIDRYS